VTEGPHAPRAAARASDAPEPRRIDSWVTDRNAALLTDLYQLTMLQAYVEHEMFDDAVFDLFARRLPEHRNFLLAAGLDDALRALETLAFTDEAIEALERIGPFSQTFLDYLRAFRFTGSVRAAPEGTPVFADEPIVEVTAPLPEAQLMETILLNQIHFQTLIASKAARVVHASRDAGVVDFALRRMHGTDAGVKGARAMYLAGYDATSDVLAGAAYDIPTSGTMAHSYIEAHDDEMEAFERFARLYGETVLLVDTYDTLEGVRKTVALAKKMGDDFKVRAVRLDSGDLGELARRSRRILNDAGLSRVGIFASGGLDEWKVDELVRTAPIDGFGVGTKIGVSADAPYLDSAYKLVAYAGRPRMKLSSEKTTLPGAKQVHRVDDESDGRAGHDVIAQADKDTPKGGRPLMQSVFKRGRREGAGLDDLETCRRRAADEMARLPDRLLGLEPAAPAYEVRVSERVREETEALRERLLSSLG